LTGGIVRMSRQIRIQRPKGGAPWLLSA
jgi:hypothetical protein